MGAIDSTPDLGIADRLRRSRGRAGRIIPASTKVTGQEQEELEAAAKRHGKSFSEWAREVLLREARSNGTEPAVFTELIALRMLANTVLRSIALGEKLSPEAYAQILTEVRGTKHEIAQDVLKQYLPQAKEQ